MTSGEYINSVLAYDENSPKKESKKDFMIMSLMLLQTKTLNQLLWINT